MTFPELEWQNYDPNPVPSEAHHMFFPLFCMIIKKKKNLRTNWDKPLFYVRLCLSFKYSIPNLATVFIHVFFQRLFFSHFLISWATVQFITRSETLLKIKAVC